MLGVILTVMAIGVLLIGPIAWRAWRDRCDALALAVRAEVSAAVRQALHGESLVAVHVEAPRPGRSGRVILSVPGGWEWLIREAWPRVVARVPADYELVVRAGARPAAPEASAVDTGRRAA
jgi:hypothetical protein